MSWQGYVDQLMKEISPGRSLTAAAVLGLDGSVWAQSLNFPQLSVEEIEKLKNSFEDVREVRENGLFLGGLKYFVMKSGEREIHGRKGTGGTCVWKTYRTFIIGFYDESCIPSEVVDRVDRVAQYLRDSQW